MGLRAESISKQFIRGGKRSVPFYAVRPTDFTLHEGQLTVLTGRSGCGKSTLLNMLAGLQPPDTGSVFLDDVDLYSLNDRELSRLRSRKLGVVPQGQTVAESLTVLENVLLPYILYEGNPHGKRGAATAPRLKDGQDPRVSEPEAAGEAEDIVRRADELLSQMGLENRRDSWPSVLSGGEARRMAIARAMLLRPQVLLADEPTSDLDEENTQLILKLLKKIAGEGTAVLMVTHEPEAERFADRICRMEAGQIL